MTPEPTKRRLGVYEAKRWLKDNFGYEVVRYMLNHEELTNRVKEDEYKDCWSNEWVLLTYVWVGNHTLILNHSERKLTWQE